MFDPYKAAREVLATTSLTDPDEVAGVVFERTPRGSVRALYRQLLRSVARDVMRTSRMDGESSAPRPNRSAKVTAIREHHVAWLAQRVYASGSWKLLGDCTREDVLDLAAQRRDSAARTLAVAAEFEALAERMAAAGAATVADLERAA